MALKVAMHNWMRPEPIETTITRLGRSGYDGIEISGEPAVYDPDEVKRKSDHIASFGLKVGSFVPRSRSSVASMGPYLMPSTSTPRRCR